MVKHVAQVCESARGVIPTSSYLWLYMYTCCAS